MRCPRCRSLQFAGMIGLLFLTACGGTMPEKLGITGGRLAPCPGAPRCVSSDAGGDHAVPPLVLAAPPDRAWPAAAEAVRQLPRTRIVKQTGDYLHAECRSAIFRFVDDLELHLRPDDNVIAVRSGARLGYYDFGVNRRRVETIRETLRREGVVE